MEKRKLIVSIDYVKCLPCSGLICVGVCPTGVFEAGTDGKPQIVDLDSCSHCGVCAKLCPVKAIIINEDESKEDK